MSLSEINIREKNFHNKLIAEGNNRSENKFYKALHNLYLDFFDYIKKYIQWGPGPRGGLALLNVIKARA